MLCDLITYRINQFRGMTDHDHHMTMILFIIMVHLLHSSPVFVCVMNRATVSGPPQNMNGGHRVQFHNRGSKRNVNQGGAAPRVC
jgi:hypothetical protein